jgi:outer membrane protein TolC
MGSWRSPGVAQQQADPWRPPATAIPSEGERRTLPPLTAAEDCAPIDLATALKLAGANNLQIAQAAERVQQAQAQLAGAEVTWLPSLNFGVGYNKHDGQLQDTRGQVLQVSRNAFFVGGGPVVGPAALNGPAGPPPRLFLGLPVVDALFAPLAARRVTEAAQAAYTSTFNDTLLQVSLAYLDLVYAQGQWAIAQDAVRNAGELVRHVQSRVRAGAAPPADGLRAQTELADRQRQQYQAQEAVRVASAELVRLLRLDPAVTLCALEAQPVPVHLIDPKSPLPDLLAVGVSNRPEMAQNQALVEATLTRLRQERWRPWLPTVMLGASAGGFGGGQGGSLRDFGGRGDFDALLVWEVRNFGLGNRALQRERASQHRQAMLTAEQIRDIILAEVARAHHQVVLREKQIEAARSMLRAASEALPLNYKGVRAGTLRAIEAQQAVQAVAQAQTQYLTALTDYNRAQFQLLRALGGFPSSGQPSTGHPQGVPLPYCPPRNLHLPPGDRPVRE